MIKLVAALLTILFLESCSSNLSTINSEITGFKYFGKPKLFTPIPFESVWVDKKDTVMFLQITTDLSKGKHSKVYQLNDTLYEVKNIPMVVKSGTIESNENKSEIVSFDRPNVFRGKISEVYMDGDKIWCEYYTPVNNSINRIQLTHLNSAMKINF